MKNPMLNRLLIIAGSLIITFVLMMHAGPRLYKKVYDAGWNDAEKHYNRNQLPPFLGKSPHVKNGRIEEKSGMWI